MRHAGRRYSVPIPITTLRTSTDSSRRVAAPLGTRSAADVAAAPDISTVDVIVTAGATEATETEVILAATGYDDLHSPAADRRGEHRDRLEQLIRQRIETRLGGRVRNLDFRWEGDTIVLQGRCATYYTKQLAQHAALGVLEDEQLENAIVVTM